MLINRDREKLLHAVAFFAENVDKCGKIKLFKLLYFLDFEHYKLTGRSVTGMDYFAWKMGPVPKDLYEEIKAPKPDLSDFMDIKEKEVSMGKMLDFRIKKKFNSDLFSKRELKIMNSLASKYYRTKAGEMIEETHLENLPWHRIYEVEKKSGEKIPYELAFRRQEYDEMVRIAKDHKEVVNSLS